MLKSKISGRGAGDNPTIRFEEIDCEISYDDLEFILREDQDLLPDARVRSLKTRFFKDVSKTIITTNDSPDLGFTYSVNSYRGCEHGCIYCYARPTHEYLGMSAGLDFESKIFVKEEAPKLLFERLMAPSWRGDVIVMSGVTDCYQPAERFFKLTRGCLEVLNQFNNPVAMITKNALVTRDIDVLTELASKSAVHVTVSVTTLSDDLCAVLEPRTSRPEARLRAIETLAKAGVPVGVNVAPVIPALTDHEMPEILRRAKESGASTAGFTVLRLPWAVAPLFASWLDRHRPERKEKILNRLRSLRGGKLYDPRFGSRMRGEGAFAENIRQVFKVSCERHGLNKNNFNLSSTHFKRPPAPPEKGDQLTFEL